jgi:hypothetical protein
MPHIENPGYYWKVTEGEHADRVLYPTTWPTFASIAWYQGHSIMDKPIDDTKPMAIEFLTWLMDHGMVFEDGVAITVDQAVEDYSKIVKVGSWKVDITSGPWKGRTIGYNAQYRAEDGLGS